MLQTGGRQISTCLRHTGSLPPIKQVYLIHRIIGSKPIGILRLSSNSAHLKKTNRQVSIEFVLSEPLAPDITTTFMAATSSYMACAKFFLPGWAGGKRELRNKRVLSVSAQQQAEVQEAQRDNVQEEKEPKKQDVKPRTKPRPVEPQVNVKSKNMSREYGGQWLSSVTRHVRIYAAYIDPETWEFDQTQMDKLTLILDPTDEFVWTDGTCSMVYSYFQELVDHYEGAPLTEYTLRLIGSDIEHYIRKLLYDGEIKYNMNARVLNFSMGKPRIPYNSDGQLQDAQ